MTTIYPNTRTHNTRTQSPQAASRFGDLTHLSTDELMSTARQIRDTAYGTTVTYSPKVFIPLTKLCRDACGYCTFAQPPARVESPYLTIEEVCDIAISGAKLGCHEALFTLGEKPELKYRHAKDWLDENGYESTVDYLAAACGEVLATSGLLPHANAGALDSSELSTLRTVAPSQGMMIESLRDDLSCHRDAPDKVPARRIETLLAAGELKIPFTTGILVGIGEDEIDRIVALEAVADAHETYGHVQEVIVQNFLPKPRTLMRNAQPCPPEAHLRAIALARIVLPPEIHVQAPPNLSEDLTALLDAGIDDWGGVSPLTLDHVNPERPWPSLEILRSKTEAGGFELAPRLTVYPAFVEAPEMWLSPEVRFAVQDRSDAAGYGRDDPGSLLPHKTHTSTNVADGPEVIVDDTRSTQWYSGANITAEKLVPIDRNWQQSAPSNSAAVQRIVDSALSDELIDADDALTLLLARGRDVRVIAEAADQLRYQLVGDDITYVRNRNINYTNVCTYKCQFCGFSKGPLSLNLRGKPYLLELDEIVSRAAEAARNGATEVCLQGGIHPGFDGDYYVEVCAAIHAAVPDIHIHGFTALEVFEGARRLGQPLDEYLRRLKAAGLKSLPGTAAEILDDDVRRVLCPDKITTKEWLETHEAAHSVGLRSNVTMMYGSIEHPRSWATHMAVTRELQQRTGGFTEFVGLPYVHMAAPLYLTKRSRRGPTFREHLLVHAVARLFYGKLIPNIQVSWVKTGLTNCRQLLVAGVNDLGGTLTDENISRAAGADHGRSANEEDMKHVADAIGRPLVQRTTLYGRLS